MDGEIAAEVLSQNAVVEGLETTDAAISYLADEGYDPDFGARPVKRAIQNLVLNELSRKILADQVDRSKPIVIDEFGDGLVFRN